MKRLAWLTAVAAAAAGSFADVRESDACSTSCWPGAFVPGDNTTVPANLPVLIWMPTEDSGSHRLENVSLTRLDTGALLGFNATRQDNGHYHIVPLQPLEAGVQYRLVDSSACFSGTGPRSTFTVTPAAPLPTRLGTLSPDFPEFAQQRLATAAGSCDVEAFVKRADVVLVYDAEAEPWRDVLHIATHVDGQRWWALSTILQRPAPGASWIGRGVDRVYTVCENLSDFGSPSIDLPSGAHEVQMRASLPGTTLALASDVAWVLLECAGLDCDGGDCGGPDGGGNPFDGGHGSDGGHGGEGEGDAGCCAAAGDGGAGAATGLGLALAGFAVRRRRGARPRG